MAIHVEHVGVLERAREVSRLEDIITEDNEDIEAEMPKMGDDPAGKEARFLQATDEMSAALTQFMKKKNLRKNNWPTFWTEKNMSWKISQ
ncbi:type III secretion system protein [Escherichia coli]|uniref:Type III secretion system protein n=1 Tax=Escherichia coli TaxID=562 RepID=A0A376VCW6_ECOLX|nr:type III secretion system protein [Escherichia coli]